MNNQNFRFNFNPRLYEENLSVFGRKVFQELIKKWQNESDRAFNSVNHTPKNYQRQRQYHSTPIPSQKRQVLNFRNDELPLPRLPPPTLIEPIAADPSYTQIDVLPKTSAVERLVLTNNEMLTSAEPDINFAYGPLTVNTVNNLLNPVNIQNNPDESGGRLTGEGNEKTHKTIPFTSVNTSKEVDWNDMFDTELIPSVDNILTTKETLGTSIEQVLKSKTLELKEDVKTKSFKQTKNTLAQKTNKKCKRKTQPQITDNIPKKTKKTNDDSTLRKQKYTKTVKNWLNDVDPNNAIEETEDTSAPRGNQLQTKMEVVKEKNKGNKKVIQALLANKGGVMKFSKPTATEAETGKTVESVNTIEKPDTTKQKTHDTTKQTNSTIKKTNEKKAKPKFVAPIKSQIPVRDVTYQITTVENATSNLDEFNNLKDMDVVAVLVYSNGFSDLNRQHTEDVCDPEGIIINVDDQSFFYFKNVDSSFKDMLGRILYNNKIVCYEGNHLLLYLKSAAEMDIHDINIIDAKIGAAVLEPDEPVDSFTDVQKLVCFTAQYTVATDCVLQKGAWYSTLLRECAAKMITLLNDQKLWKVFYDIEMRLVPVIAEMEHCGVTVDMVKLKSMEDLLLSKMHSVEQQCYRSAGRVFQINSATQVGAIVYDELRLDAKCNVKIRETICKGAKSTNEAMLRSLTQVHPLPKLILEYRHLHKAHATFLSGIAQHVKDGIVKPTWVQLAAATGRIASNNPNLQAIPKAPFNLVLFPEHNEDTEVVPPLVFRSVYCAREGCTLVAADFRHVECRVWAQLAGAPALRAALAAPDLFTVLAADWLEKPQAEVSACERERTKRVVYASLYGAGARALADVLQVTYEQALAVHSSFNRSFPCVKRFWSRVAQEFAAAGAVRSVSGRVRRPPPRAAAIRQAVNFVIQGSAADLCKLSMARCCGRLRGRGLRARLLLQIHDELVWEVARADLRPAARIIKEVMEGAGEACELTVPLPVAVAVGDNWGDMTPYEP